MRGAICSKSFEYISDMELFTPDEIKIIDEYLNKTRFIGRGHFDFRQILKKTHGDLPESEIHKIYKLVCETAKVIEGLPPDAKLVRISELGKDVIEVGSWNEYRSKLKSLQSEVRQQRDDIRRTNCWTRWTLGAQVFVSIVTGGFVFASAYFDKQQYNLNLKIYNESKITEATQQKSQIQLLQLSEKYQELYRQIDSLKFYIDSLRALKPPSDTIPTDR